jgi:hypothetical protein
MRNWAIRGMILGLAAGLVGLVWLARTWVSPERVRQQVEAYLRAELPGWQVQVGSAHLRLLGGIAVRHVSLRLPSASASAPPTVHAPYVLLHHDKEQLNRGRLLIRKIELEEPELSWERQPDGSWNLGAWWGSVGADKSWPTVLMRQATVHMRDPSGVWPSLTVRQAQVTILNDPLPLVSVQIQGQVDGWGAVILRARYNRLDGSLAAGIELPACPLQQALATGGSRLLPLGQEHLRGLEAVAAISADLTYLPQKSPPWRCDLRLELRDGRFQHPDIPWPVEKLTASIQVSGQKIVVEQASGEIAGASLHLNLESRSFVSEELTSAASGSRGTNTSQPPWLQRLEENLQRLELAVHGVALEDALFQHLPHRVQELRRRFAPRGQLDLTYKFQRLPQGSHQEIELRPRQMRITYDKFPYPLEDLRGTIRQTLRPQQAPQTVLDLVASASGHPITLKGTVTGEGPDPGIQLRLSGTNIPLDEKLIAAFPPKYAALIRRFHAQGYGDFVAEITQYAGVNRLSSEFRVDIRDGRCCYEAFPYPLEKVRGRLVVRVVDIDPQRPVRPGEPVMPPPDEDELILDGFTAVHAGAPVWLHGQNRPLPASRDRLLTLRLGGTHCPLDEDLRTALAALRLAEIWEVFSPRGHFNFTADVQILERAAASLQQKDKPTFQPGTDLKLTLHLSGPTLTPRFFPYELNEVSGWLEYKNGRVELAHWQARHGPTRCRLQAAEVRFFPDGSLWANLGQLEAHDVQVEADLLRALPRSLAQMLQFLQLRGQIHLRLQHLVVRTAPELVQNVAGTPPEPAPLRLTSGMEGATWGKATPAPGNFPPPTPSAPVPPAAGPIIYWDGEVHLADAAWDTGVSWAQVHGRIACRGRYEGDHLGAVLGAVWLDRAVIADQPLQRILARFRTQPQRPDPQQPGQFQPVALEVHDLRGEWFHGTIGGQARVQLAEPVTFQLWLNAAEVQLEAVAAHYQLSKDADLKGLAQAQLYVYNRLDASTGHTLLEGAGKIDVPAGRLYNLPILLDLLKVLKLQAPDKTAFEEAHAVFRIRGDRILVEQVDLIGKAICLGGSGEMDIRGEYVQFDFYTIGSQILARLVHTPVGDLTAFLSKNLFRIRLTREGGQLVYKPEAVPLITEPVRRIADRLRARAAPWLGSGEPP